MKSFEFFSNDFQIQLFRSPLGDNNPSTDFQREFYCLINLCIKQNEDCLAFYFSRNLIFEDNLHTYNLNRLGLTSRSLHFFQLKNYARLKRG